MTDTRQCTQCGVSFSAVMAKCPFCGAAQTASGAGTARGAFDFATVADHAIAQYRPFVALEYHPASILALDALLELSFGPEGVSPGADEWRPPDATMMSIAASGAFAGEVLRRAWGGAWQLHATQPEKIMAACLVLPSGEQIHPLVQVYHRAKSGGSQSLVGWYARLRAKNRVDEGDLAGWIRYAEGFARIGRADWAERFYNEAARVSGDPAWTARARTLSVEAHRAVAIAARIQQARDAIAAWEREGERQLAACGARTDTGCMTLTAVDFLVRDLFGSRMAPDTLGEDQRAVMHGLGAFVGRVLCRRFNAQWCPDGDLPPERWQVGWDAGERASPFAMLTARIEAGASRLVLEQVATAIRAPCERGACVDPPEDPAAWSEQARSFAQAGKLRWAVEFGRMARHYGDDTQDLRYDIGEWLCKLERYKEAVDEVQAGLDRDDRSARGWSVRALAMTGLGEHAQAEQANEFARKLQDRPWESPWPQAKPTLEAMLADAEQAPDLNSALVLYGLINQAYPDYPEAWRERGVALARLGRPDTALQCFERGIELDPREPKSHDHKAALLGQLARWDEALRTLDAGLVLCPDAKVLMQRRGIYLSRMGRRAESLAQFDALLARFPGDPHVLKLRAEVARTSG